MRRGWAAPAGPLALVGRDGELERLAAAVTAARAGHGKIVLISAEPGTGKTAILDHDAGALLKVVDAYAAARRPLLEDQAREHAAEALAATGRRAEARLQLDAVQDRYAQLGAVWDMARADARLRAHGIRCGVHGEQWRPKAGWAALTDTEQAVATLLAEGLSDPDIAARMFISRRTVQFHVSNILAKLSLSSRVEVAALVTRRGVTR